MNKGLVLICMFAIYIFSVIAEACSCPPCPSCYRKVGSYPDCGCVWNCGSGQTCCGGSCCSTRYCCDGKKCYNPGTEHCCSSGTGKTCPNGKNCCGSNCCDPDKICCGSNCCDPNTETCCNGQCCSSEDCKSCVGGECKVCGGDPSKECCGGQCITKCDSDQCLQCDGEGGCESKCGPNEECCNGECCNTTTKKCCADGSCVEPCTLGEEDNSCAGSTLWCMTQCIGNPWCEALSVHRVYSGGGTNSCSGGCPGECHESNTPKTCYIDYPCKNMSVPFSVCMSDDCGIYLFDQCYWCYADMNAGVPHTVPIWECGE